MGEEFFIYSKSDTETEFDENYWGGVKPKPKYKVTAPYREFYQWPEKCSLCRNPVAKEKKSVIGTVQKQRICDIQETLLS